MICPHCKKELLLPCRTVHNVEGYNKSALSVTECCGKPVTVSPIRGHRVREYIGNATEDDWGVRFT